MKVSKHAFVVAVFLCALGCSISSVRASQVEVEYDFTTTNWETPDFSIVGDSSWADDSGVTPNKRLRLTDNTEGQVGSAWFNAAQIDAARSWSVSYQWQFSYATNTGGDGLGFHIQTEGTGVNVWPDHAKTTAGWFSIEVDSYQNAGEESGTILRIFFNATSVGTLEIGGLGNGDLNNDKYRNDISYNADLRRLYITVTDLDTDNSASYNHSLDLGSVFDGGANAYVGFSGRTGTATENHDVLDFSMSAVPEPATLALLAGGAVLFAARRRCK